MQFEVCDLVKDEIPPSFPSPDYASLIFVLSAINPIHFESVAGKMLLKKYLLLICLYL